MVSAWNRWHGVMKYNDNPHFVEIAIFSQEKRVKIFEFWLFFLVFLTYARFLSVQARLFTPILTLTRYQCRISTPTQRLACDPEQGSGTIGLPLLSGCFARRTTGRGICVLNSRPASGSCTQSLENAFSDNAAIDKKMAFRSRAVLRSQGDAVEESRRATSQPRPRRKILKPMPMRIIPPRMEA